MCIRFEDSSVESYLETVALFLYEKEAILDSWKEELAKLAYFNDHNITIIVHI